MNLKKILILLIFTWFAITLAGGLTLRNTLEGSSEPITPEKSERTSRLAFFSDIHIQNSNGEVQTDFGSPSSEIPKNTKVALETLNPDFIFNPGDATSHAEIDEWKGYKKWIDGFEAPVFDVFGNHDREHHPGDNYGTGYFTELNRTSGTKVLKLGNNVFILVSEEHNPEFDNNNLASTIPKKRFEFIEKYLKKYSKSNNVFIINHTPLSGTTAFSRTWYYGLNKNWIHLTNKFFTLLENYDVAAHISGHIHTDYRWRDEPGDSDGTIGVENLDKFVSGMKITNSSRLYAPYRLPETYFLNMPAADFAHGWGARFYFMAFPKGNPTTKTSGEEGSSFRKYEELGPSIFDIFHNPRTSGLLGRGAVYYADFTENQERIDIITRWASGNMDVENFGVKLEHPIELGDENIHFIASDLSLRKKENLVITRDNWFKIKSGTRGVGVFSKRFGENEQFEENRVKIENYNLKSYSVEWWGKQKIIENWKKFEAFENIEEIKAVKIKINFEASHQKDAYIEDIVFQK